MTLSIQVQSAMTTMINARNELLATCSAKDAELNQEHGVQVYGLCCGLGQLVLTK